ncbi:MAG TPA: hypothetical protein VLT32_15630 [Candidatus Sulfomarinibacteraceae bacterium]|nr:hypothetical protein [Candidatus Sulfomarinibacteraceae bacterium]
MPAAFAAIGLLLAPLPPAAAAEPSLSRNPTIRVGPTSTDQLELLRCHLDEGRIAIRFRDEIVVLREGEHLAGAGLRVVEITPDSATITIELDQAGLRLLRITRAEDGNLTIREYAVDSVSLTAGSPSSSGLGVAIENSVATPRAEAPSADDAGNR